MENFGNDEQGQGPQEIKQPGLREFRNMQEACSRLVDGGYYKEHIRLMKAYFDEFLAQGFNRMEAHMFVTAMFCRRDV